MAKKVLVVKQSSSRSLKRGVPEGYKTIERAPNWDFEKDAVVQGIRGPIVELEFGRRGEDKRLQRTFTIKDQVLGEVAIWESSRLTPLFDTTNDGDDVYIEFLGYQEAKVEGDSPTKLFKCAARPKAGYKSVKSSRSSAKDENPF